ncbi:MAG: twin-arginine translocase TatA/TatE family subunit [Bacteroidetes bacterium]|nr:MAG: twin-arginine translocase TatA/TatE family subunit [Bacteroidota bacterium]RLD88887.1 MAG: twin-arginine translocase TatA/TatE family subunit [Bacteroidota bacterium]HHJ09984.1 twin-arginine translocase TatA/TatE family subunit [Bacteroidota bacterium]
MNFLANIDTVQHAGWIGTPEIIIIVVVIVLLFGGRKIPELMRGIGKGVKEFREGIGGEDEKKETGETPETPEKKTDK